MSGEDRNMSAERAEKNFKRGFKMAMAAVIAAPLSIALVALAHLANPGFMSGDASGIAQIHLAFGLVFGGFSALIGLLIALDFGKTNRDPRVGLSGRRRLCFVAINVVVGFLSGYAFVGLALAGLALGAVGFSYLGSLIESLAPVWSWFAASPLRFGTAIGLLGVTVVGLGAGCLRNAHLANEEARAARRKYFDARDLLFKKGIDPDVFGDHTLEGLEKLIAKADAAAANQEAASGAK